MRCAQLRFVDVEDVADIVPRLTPSVPDVITISPSIFVVAPEVAYVEILQLVIAVELEFVPITICPPTGIGSESVN